ncbi:MAG: thioredoxin [Puniceicoccales bacterium]|jgi:thioredoxin 1|nr:thioredoxin [Puniceicoccales bacterium]
MLHLNSSNFEAEVSSNRLVVVDFWAPWCGPCRALGPTMEEVSSEVEPGVAVAKLDIDECPELAEKFGVQSIPTVIFFKNGVEVKRFVGLATKADILASINSM